MVSVATARSLPVRTGLGGGRPFGEFRSAIDQVVLELFRSRELHQALHGPGNVNLAVLWDDVARLLDALKRRPARALRGQRDVHRHLVEGLPGEALFIAAAMAFDSLKDALPLFDVSAKTARARLGARLSSAEGEIALRIGRVLSMAGDAFASLPAARTWLLTPNFALGGAVPRDLLKTAEGEQLVVAELQAQAEGGPV